MVDKISPVERSRVMAAVKSKDTTPEMVVRRMVHSMGYRYRLHAKHLPGTPDLVLPCLRKVVNVNGCFWHMHSCGRCRIPASRRSYWIAKIRRNAERDKRTRRRLQRAGWRVLVVWECQTLPKNLERLRARIERFLDGGSRKSGTKRPKGTRSL
jgi:DNA mismatch endonuclease (patch repair protein)